MSARIQDSLLPPISAASSSSSSSSSEVNDNANQANKIATKVLKVLGIILMLVGIISFVAAPLPLAIAVTVSSVVSLALGFGLNKNKASDEVAPNRNSNPDPSLRRRDPAASSGLQKPRPSGRGISHPNLGGVRNSFQIIPRPSGRGSSFPSNLSEAVLAEIRKIPEVPPLSSDSLKFNYLPGVVIGQAVGDALGLATEFLSKERARALFSGRELELTDPVFGQGRPAQFVRGGFTDDTEHACLIIRAIDQHQKNPGKSLTTCFAEQLLHWRAHGLDGFKGQYKTAEETPLTGARDVGMTIGNVIARSNFLQNPQQAALDVWLESRRSGAANGAVMRTSVIGAIYYRDLAEVVKQSILFASVTHADPRCIASAVALSVAIALFLQGHQSPTQVMQYAQDIAIRVLQDEMQTKAAHYHDAEEVTHLSTEYTQELVRHLNANNWGDLELDDAGMGYTYKCVGAAFYALRKFADGARLGEEHGFRTVIREIIEEGGDADTNAAAAGALLGAYFGLHNIPESWLQGLNANAQEVLEENASIMRRISGLDRRVEEEDERKAEYVEDGEAASEVDEMDDEEEMMDDLSMEDFAVSSQFFSVPVDVSIPSFTPLTPKQLTDLLAEVPELENTMVAQGYMTAVESITGIHARGIPARITNASLNQELMQQMQYIIFSIRSNSSAAKREDMLVKLAVCLEDCVPVTQGRVGNMYRELSGQGLFTTQMSTFIERVKEDLADQTIYAMFPAMADPNYAAANHGDPSMQFPHMKNGMIALRGTEVGINPKIARTDPNCNTIMGDNRGGEFVGRFREGLTTEHLVREFVLEINKNGPNITNEQFTIWCGANGLGEEVFYDDARVYPSYADTPDARQQAFQSAFINESTALKVFQKLGYIN